MRADKYIFPHWEGGILAKILEKLSFKNDIITLSSEFSNNRGIQTIRHIGSQEEDKNSPLT